MKTRTGLAGLAVAALLLAGCGSTTTDVKPETVETQQADVVLTAADIETIDDGIAWARGIDRTASAKEISGGINRIGELVPDLDIWFADNNEIGGALISLNADVLSDPDKAGTKVDDLNAIIDDLEASIERGPKP